MDLGTIQGQLNDFATFGKNIGTALQNIPGLINGVIGFVDNFEALSSATETAATSS
ncbi:MAG TPA: PorH family porin [Corynebacterium sp.]|nr:PorH family porin [Corynebacterium sp.]HZK31544.1 PorH family porin [Corynebacterium sp.]